MHVERGVRAVYFLLLFSWDIDETALTFHRYMLVFVRQFQTTQHLTIPLRQSSTFPYIPIHSYSKPLGLNSRNDLNNIFFSNGWHFFSLLFAFYFLPDLSSVLPYERKIKITIWIFNSHIHINNRDGPL